MTPEIIEKLNKFLSKHVPFTEECEIVYLMVELRKLLDSENEHNPLVHFYCDWTVHINKDRNVRLTEQVKRIVNYILEAHNVDFLMPALRTEMSNLFVKYAITEELFDEKSWKCFVSLFVQILADQPIEKLQGSVSSFCYNLGYKDRIVVEITFSDYREKQTFESETIF